MTPHFRTLDAAASWFEAWLRDAALPLWAGAGLDASGSFYDSLSPQGRPLEGPRRARVQARNVFVYAMAAKAGFGTAWGDVAAAGFDSFYAAYGRPDGLVVSKLHPDGRVLDDTPAFYEQDFALLAMAALHAVDPARADLPAAAARLMAGLQALRHPAGGFREFGDHPFQANAHMHFLEATLAWEDVGADDAWTRLSDDVVALAMTRFIDAEAGFLREFFDADWRPAAGDDGRLVEPGHQFEWAWLLERWGVRRGDAAARRAARRLYAHGLRGVDRARGVAINGLWDDFTLREATARLWPQTEYLKAALILEDEAEALAAAGALAGYLDTPARGAWRDKLLADGTFLEEPAPASSFYLVMMAILELLRASSTAANRG